MRVRGSDSAGPGPLVYGIDVGMSHSTIMVGQPDGTVAPVDDPHPRHAGRYALPTAVCLRPDGTVTVGFAADHDRLHWPGGYRQNFKREFGDKDLLPFGDGRVHQTYEIAGHLLRYLRYLAQDRHAGTPDAVAIAVPASWERATLARMRRAAAFAGFPPDAVDLVKEPVAAAEWAVEHLGGEPGTILVYDLGGATFGCAVAVSAGGGRYHLLDHAELDNVGGADFDQSILDIVRHSFPVESAALFTDIADPTALTRQYRLRDGCRELKHRLSGELSVREPLTELGPGAWFELSRTKFERLIALPIDRTVARCGQLLSSVDKEWRDLDAVLLVGGSSQIPLVSARLDRHAPGRVVAVPAPQLAVARGAAIRARRRALGTLTPGPDRAPPARIPPARIPPPPSPPPPSPPPPSPPPPSPPPPSPPPSSPPPSTEPSPPPELSTPGTPARSGPPGGPRMWGGDLAAPEPAGPRVRAAGLAWLAWAGVTLPLAGLRWTGWPTVAVCLVAVTTAAVLLACAVREKSGDGDRHTVTTCTVAAGVGAACAAVAHTVWALDDRPVEWLFAAWALACAATTVLLARQAGALMAATCAGAAARRELAARYRSVADVVGRRVWLGDTQAVPLMFAPLRGLSGTRIFPLPSDDQFAYAVADGDRVVLVHLAESVEPPPRLRTATARWRGRLQHAVSHLPGVSIRVNAVVVLPVGALPETTHRGGIQRVTPDRFADTAIELLGGGTGQVLVPLVAALLAEARRRPNAIGGDRTPPAISR